MWMRNHHAHVLAHSFIHSFIDIAYAGGLSLLLKGLWHGDTSTFSLPGEPCAGCDHHAAHFALSITVTVEHRREPAAVLSRTL
jgi:hypothetical protein